MKKLVRIALMVALLGACAWFSLYLITFLMWQIPPKPDTHAIELADLDGDGDLDAFLANGRNERPEPNTVLWNDGQGTFQDSGQRLGNFESSALALADFDDDGDVDALVSNISWGEYFWNDGQGLFQLQPYKSVSMPSTEGFPVGYWRFKPGDLNGDNQVDLFLTGCCGGGISNGPDGWQTLNASNSIWLSDGSGLPRDSSQQFGLGNSETVALADLEGDGDLDAFLANSTHMDEKGDPVDYGANEVWFNNGRGIFTDSGQRLGKQRSYTVAAGDLDGDGDIDALVGNRGSDEVWWNDGQGHFSVSDQAMGDTLTRNIYLSDLDGDGDLDAFLGSDKQGRIWLNDGRGRFSDSGQRLDYSNRHAIALGDVDADGTVDVVAAKIDTAVVWLNDGAGQMHKMQID
jgi:hypothetical protein